ncbi:MAG: hypothetical protein UV73_C0001G0216 [Candidatus Gottesmanbacteria bacterium GW2011_GWA2_43_14]|uniref:Uncharacterized protein n=1 Tax=Candidatus Gottesmanbacteria bacterium GW2011_GWA2_43_14 TaxID=1618443 RepID=A0A0G1DLG7_9BACT|nr:MAG: hypothetical protein UV73_C0001G0216 [Candidatus Gottesmanbacteria bacterium GW2011_GWA2_43_14]
MKKIISAAFGTAIFLASASPSFAANTVRIIDTGAESWNIGAIVKLRRTTVSNPQNATVTNNVTSNVNSGKNKVEYNTKVLGDVGTGDATSTTDVLTQVNDSTIEVNGCGCDEDTTVKIDQTGYKSKNIAVVVDTQEIRVNNRQDARVVNNISSSANSGENVTSYNTKVDGGISTGNASSTTIVTTVANTSSITVGP